MRVVVNKCFGGFGISDAAEKAYLARKGLEQFLYTDKRDAAFNCIGFERYTGQKQAFVTYTFTEDMGDFFEKFPNKHPAYFYSNDIPRDDLDLVAVVEEMGVEANGRFAKLSVVDIPDGVEWEIEEYYGKEWIAEKHRTW